MAALTMMQEQTNRFLELLDQKLSTFPELQQLPNTHSMGNETF